MEATTAAPPEPGTDDVPLPGEEPSEQEEPRRRVVIEGDGQLSLAVGGKRPTDSEVKIVICLERWSGAFWPGWVGRKSAVDEDGLERKSVTTGAW